MLTDAAVSILVPVWIATIPLLALALGRFQRRRWALQRGEDVVRGSWRGRRGVLVALSVSAGLLAGFVAVFVDELPWPLVWVPFFVAAGAAIAAAWLAPARAAVVTRTRAVFEDAVAAAVGVSFAVLAILVHRPSTDDVYYVNRATATDELGHIPVRDVLVTNEQAPPASGVGLPVDTFSALQGALAHVADVHAASVAYYVTPPLFTFLATWALWRLVRAWAPRALLACFALGCVYWLYTAQDFLTAGSYFLPRMWQGKVIFVAWLVPTLWVHLTRWLEGRDAITAALLLAGGVSSLGMTGSATFVMPLLFGAAALPLLVERRWRGLPILAAAAAFPFVVGLAITRKYPLAEVFSVGIVESPYVFSEIFATGIVAAVGMLALCWSPWLARTPWASRAMSGIVAVVAFLLAPEVIPAIGELAGLTETVRRTLWMFPLPALVALLAALPVPRVAWRPAALAPALVLGAILVVFGQPIWEGGSGESRLRFPPEWKTPPGALADARAILARYDGPGPILADRQVMKAISLITVETKAVSPREWYVKLIPDARVQADKRIRLADLVSGKGRSPTAEQIEDDLAALRVPLVCVPAAQTAVLAKIRAAGPYTEAFRARRQICLERAR